MTELVDARLVSGANPNAGSDDAAKGTQQDIYFFTSIEDFPPGIGDLSLTHDDAQGFYDYVKQFNTPNGWYRDGNVGQWIYEETYDNWQDDYGFDAAKVVYHSGHGGMASDGVFSIPVGNDWGGDHWTSSTDMRLGNEYARYVFWSTCESVRVKAGHSPMRTWSAANLGLRMIFGYETTSVDNGNYGRFLWEEWNKNNKSFSTAFLDASWRISHHQEPAVTACGATQAEATDRLFNERLFDAGRANTSWWWWRWYDMTTLRARTLDVPTGTRSAKLGPAGAHDLAAAWTDRFGGSAKVVLGANGAREITLAAPADTDRELTDDEAVAVARRAIEQYRLAEHADLAVDHIRYDRHAGGSASEQVAPRIRERSVGFVQLIDGTPVVSPDRGRLQVRVDNERTVTGVVDSTRPVADLRDAPAAPPGGTGRDVEELFGAALQRRLRRAASSGRVPSAVRPVPESSEVGYAVRGDNAVLVARREVEVDFGGGLSKRYVLEEPIS